VVGVSLPPLRQGPPPSWWLYPPAGLRWRTAALHEGANRRLCRPPCRGTGELGQFRLNVKADRAAMLPPSARTASSLLEELQPMS